MSARFAYLVATVVVVAAGLLVRWPALGLPWPVAKYAGSTLWGAMVYLILRMLRPSAPIVRTCMTAVAAALIVEFSRLYHTPALDAFRTTLAGRLLLGALFSPWNIVAYVAGIVGAALAEDRAACYRRRMGDPKRNATLIGFGAIALWAMLALLTKASGEAPPFELAALTFAVGGAVGLAYAAARGRLAALAQPWRVWAVGVGGLFGYHALYFAALRAAPAAEASLVAYLWPLLIVLMSATLPGERLQAKHVFGAALGFVGAALLFFAKGDSGSAPNPPLGLALALGCAFVWSSYSIASRFLKSAPTEAVAGFCLVTAALAALCHLVFETTVWPKDVAEVAAIVMLGLGPVGLAFYVWDYGVKRGDIRLLGVAAYAAPVLSTLILVAAGYAPATPWLGLACAAIVGGAYVAAR